MFSVYNFIRNYQKKSCITCSDVFEKHGQFGSDIQPCPFVLLNNANVQILNLSTLRNLEQPKLSVIIKFSGFPFLLRQIFIYCGDAKIIHHLL